MINDVMSKRERLEEQKIMDAIHNQAKWMNLEEQNKRTMEKIDKELSKKSKIKEVLRNELETALLLIIAAPGFIALALLMFCLTK